MTDKIPRVGLGVILLKKDKVLLGLRKGTHGAGTWAFPGGHLEYFESFEDCAKREVKEETGLDINLMDKNPVATTNDLFIKDNKHYITTYLRARYIGGTPRLMEPDKCAEWKWFNWYKMPSNLVVSLENLTKFYNPFK